MINLKADKKVVVTGGAGFLSSAVGAALAHRGCRPEQVVSPRRKDFDPVHEADVIRLFETHRPEVVIHLAAVVGGIGANREPRQLLLPEHGDGRAAHGARAPVGRRKFVAIGTICAYPKFTPVPLQGRRSLERLPGGDQRALRHRQEGAAGACRRPTASSTASNAVYLSAREPLRAARQLRPRDLARDPGADPQVRGGGGPRRRGGGAVGRRARATREFLYVDDAAEGIVLAAEHYDGREPVNLGAGFEISIKDLAESIARITAFKGRLVWDSSKPDGQPRRCLDTTRAERFFGFRAKMPFDESLRRTIEWYRSSR